MAAILVAAFTLLVWRSYSTALTVFHAVFLMVFGAAVIYRGLAILIARPLRRVSRLDDAALPTYTVIAPLYYEAAMAKGLTAALAALDYPRDRLQILIVLEADDEDTRRAFTPLAAAHGFHIVIAPKGTPQTKPRACNVALAGATGRFVVVYDAEDRPHPLQLKEAAARFALGGPKMACLQAPLRIAGAKGLLSRQFALEYAAQFEIVLPALTRVGSPFPLGGTSNHFSGIMHQMGQASL